MDHPEQPRPGAVPLASGELTCRTAGTQDILGLVYDLTGLVRASMKMCEDLDAAVCGNRTLLEKSNKLGLVLAAAAEKGEALLIRSIRETPLQASIAPDEIIHEISNLVFSVADKKVRFERKLGAAHHHVQISRFHIQQVVYQLLRHAMAAVSAHTGMITLSAWVDHYQGRDTLMKGRSILHIDILDSGPGVTPTIRERLSRLLFRGKKSSHQTGLFNVRSILQGYGGSILARPAPLGGTSMKVTWPEVTGGTFPSA